MGQAAPGGTLPGGVQVGRGRPTPRGCSEESGGAVNFALDAPGSSSAWLLLIAPARHAGLAAARASAEGAEIFVPLDPSTNRSGDTWHIELSPPFPPAGVKYAWLLDPPLGGNKEPAPAAKRIIDPCARCLDSPPAQAWNRRGNKRYSPLAVVPDRRTVQEFDWQGVTPPGLHLKDLIIYEAHVRGFTKNRDSGLSDWDALSGTFLGFVEKIPYLKRLGVNCVELLPVFEFDETACPRKNPFTGENLCNYWGYSTVSFCVPMQRFSSRDRVGAAIVGFKTLVRELHRQGIEVLLDVVFNHTAEGTWGETNWHSMAAIAKSRYYLLSKGHDTNYTGCGNTVNANDGLCTEWIIDCMCYWVEDMHVDGFRFDLASALCRGGDGNIMREPNLIKRMCSDPRLSRAKLIAEPWDCSWPSGYLVGKFPSCGPPRFAEWNGMWRDTVRRFIKGDEGMKGDFATRMSGSNDLFQHNGRGPFHSINFITAHDGFTLRDLVSYNSKHNDSNNEQSGDDHNNSWNCGAEGNTGDGRIRHLREKQIRNFLVALMLSCGTPMLVFGDEYGRSQNGCNNGWCQDSLSWFSWKVCGEEENKLFRFTRLLIALRKQYAHIFCRTGFLSGKDIWWRVHWDDPYNYICYVLHDREAKGGYGGLLIAFNAGHEVRGCSLPADKQWHRLIDTNLGPPNDFCDNELKAVKISSAEYMMQPYSCIVLKTFASASDAVDYSQSDMEYSQEQQELATNLAAITNRRMSMELTSLLPPAEPSRGQSQNFALSMMERRCNMSGCFVEIAASEPGQEPSMEVQRPSQGHSQPESAAAASPKAAGGLAFEPLPREVAVRPATSGSGAEALAADLGGGRRVEVLAFDGEAPGAKVLEVTAEGFGSGELILHWGAIMSPGAAWQQPPAELLAASFPSSKAVPGAVQTRFPPEETHGERTVSLLFTKEHLPRSISFVLHRPPGEWLKHGGADFSAAFPKAQEEMAAAVERARAALEPDWTQRSVSWTVRGFRLAALAAVGPGGCVVKMVANTDESVMLHYGAGDANSKWMFARSVDFAAAKEACVREATATLAPGEVTDKLMFVLRIGKDHWVKDGARDFALELPEDPQLVAARAEAEASQKAAIEAVRAQAKAEVSAFKENLAKFRSGREDRKKAADVKYFSFELSDEAGDVDVACAKLDGGSTIKVDVSVCLDPKVAPPTSSWLHWGALVDSRMKEWQCPPEELLPSGSRIHDAKACQSPLEPLGSGAYGLHVRVPCLTPEGGEEPEPTIAGLGFVVRAVETDKWLKGKDGKNCTALFHVAQPTAGAWNGSCQEAVSKIISSECEWSHMTLMHRYNLCSEILGEWEGLSDSGEAAMRRLPSWTGIFRADTRRSASFSRLPSFTLLQQSAAEADEARDAELWSWVFVWQRFSFMRLLDWQRSYNTKPRELAGATDGLANRLCGLWKQHPHVRLWARWTLATLGRGGNRGQEIRDEILHIMHRNKIPETAGHFYEQWHQKLHNNTTPDDVGICKALLAFLRSGGAMAEYWKELKDQGISKERLASYERPITHEPYLHGNTGQLIMEFENYLRILQSVHDALDLQTSVEAAKGCLPADVLGKLQDICAKGPGGGLGRRSRSLSDLKSAGDGNLDGSHQSFMRLADARSALLGILNDKRTSPDVIRQVLLLDYSLETQQTVLIQGMGAETRLSRLSDQMQALLTSVLGHMPLHAELRAVLVDWMQLAGECAALRYNGSAVESALLLKAMCDRLSRVVGEQVDMFQQLMGPKAYHLGRAVGVGQQILDIFVDEVLRGSALFSVSLVLKRLEPQLRSVAHLPPWQMISAVDHPVQGELVVVERMLHMQDKIFETPTVLLSGAVSGEEEVPVGVQAVLVRDAASAPDILSHCAVRARNSGVLLATCFDPDITKRLEGELAGQWVEVRCRQDGTVAVERTARPGSDAKQLRMMSRSASRDLTQELLQSRPEETKLVNMNLKDDLGCRWCIEPAEMDGRQVGSKSLNLATLAPKLPSGVRTPQAVAMPYGCMQKVLTHKANSERWLSKLEAVLQRLQPTTSNADARAIFEEVQAIVEELSMPPELEKALVQSMETAGDKDGERRLCKLFQKAEAWDATRKVWASLFGLRPWVSLAKAGRSFHDLNMAVLVQELLPAKYAFVLHTKNPFTNDPTEVYGELVPGRGETLVGNCPGRALSFRAKQGEAPVVSAFLSKSTWLRTQECLIFRSDSNGEDLEGFAGAGLFESICAKSDVPCIVRFHRLQVVTDPAYRKSLLQRLADVGRSVEQAFGGAPQDIEGCVDTQDRIFIVQSRPQV